MVHLNCSFLTRLSNQEFPHAIKEVCSIYKEEQVEELHVKESLSRLKAHESELQFMWEMRNPHRLTPVLQKQLKECKGYLLGLRARIKAIKRSPHAEEREAARVLYLWINKHRKHIYSESSIIQTRLVDNLMTEVANDADISEAVQSLDFINLMNSIKILTAEITENVNVRHDETQKSMRKAEEVKRAVYADLVFFLKSLQTAVNLEDPDVGFYMDYELKIESRFDKYRKRLALRSTRRKNSQLEDDNLELPVDENGDVVEQSENGEMTSMSVMANSDNGEGVYEVDASLSNGFDQEDENSL